LRWAVKNLIAHLRIMSRDVAHDAERRLRDIDVMAAFGVAHLLRLGRGFQMLSPR
jgi:hypothetical protein